MDEEKKNRKKKTVIVLVILVVLGILGGVGWYFRDQITSYFSPAEKITNPLGVQEKKKEFNFKYKVWEDPAGFSFEYPDEIEIDIHVEDESNYSFLTLSSSNRKGNINIVCNDSQYKDIKN